MRTTKASCDRKHAKKRMGERYEIVFTSQLCHHFKNLIRGRRTKKANAVLLERQTLTRATWAIFYESRWIPVVYSKSTKQIVSVLPPEYLDDFENLLK